MTKNRVFLLAEQWKLLLLLLLLLLIPILALLPAQSDGYVENLHLGHIYANGTF